MCTRHFAHLFSLMNYQQADKIKYFGCSQANNPIPSAAPGTPPSAPGWAGLERKQMPTQGIRCLLSTSLAPLATLKSQILPKNRHVTHIQTFSNQRVDVSPYQNKTQK